LVPSGLESAPKYCLPVVDLLTSLATSIERTVCAFSKPVVVNHLSGVLTKYLSGKYFSTFPCVFAVGGALLK